MGVTGTRRNHTKTVLVEYLEKHAGQRPRDVWRTLVAVHPHFTYDMVVSALRKLVDAEELRTTTDEQGHTLYWPNPPEPLPWVHPYRARYLQRTGALR